MKTNKEMNERQMTNRNEVKLKKIRKSNEKKTGGGRF